jgi:erythromycin esterase-like protein
MGEDARLKRWAFDPLFSGTVKTDSTEQINGKYLTVIENLNFMGRNDYPVRIKLQQQMLLPDLLLPDTAEVSITYKNLNIKQMNLTVSGLDKYENPLYSDTLFLPEENEWTLSTIRVPLRDVTFFCLYVLVQGIDSFCTQRCWLDRITIKIDGESIESFQPQKCMENTALPKKEIIPLSFSDAALYHLIPELKAKRIFALGETVHGSETFSESAFQLIKHQVQYNNCKLILLELPLERGFLFNRFVQGDESFEIDRLLSLIKNSLFDWAKYKELLLWLKEYNRHAEEKVWLMGMDIEIDINKSKASLFDYLYTINQGVQQPVIDTLRYQIIKNDLIKVTASASKNTKLQSIIGEKEYDILVHCLNISDKASPRMNIRLDKRDSVMFENARFLISLLCGKEEKTFIYAHLGHANYRPSIQFSNSYNITLGLLMKQAYREDYFVTGLFAGSGYFRTQWKNAYEIKPMPLTPSNSLEHLLNKINKDYFYLSSLPECPATIRCMGNGYKEDAFEPMSLCSRMDAAIYIRESQASVMSPDISPDENAEFWERFSKCIEKDKLKFLHNLTH